MSDPLRQTLEKALSPGYTVERELGGGGMSRVFLATEVALGRKVVVKVLSPELGAEVSADRFRREIQLVAQMQHSCIVPVLNTGIAGTLPYYTMPLVEGETLRARLSHGGELPIAEVVRILRDILEALSYAHERGIVHRDIKPENVLLSRHHALLADFGVAKAITVAAGGGSSLTSHGVVLGTPAYMAPEQAAADPSTDHRADLYAVGALAYEMLSGQQLFTARSPQAMLAAQAVEQPEPVDRRRTSTPPPLAALVMRALAKTPADRPQTADEMLRELEAVLTPGSGTSAVAASSGERRRTRRQRFIRYAGIGAAALAGALAVGAALLLAPADGFRRAEVTASSVAVLPFANLSGSQSDEYLSDGISEEVIGALSRVPGIQVAARTSSFAFRGRNVDARTIGERLAVGHILGGSVQRSGNRLRVSAQLTDVRTGYNRWSESYDRELTDIFALQDDISRAIVNALRPQLAAKTGPRRAPDPQAYELYLQGRYLLNQRGQALLEARERFEEAIARDSNFAAAYAALAETYFVSASWAFMPLDQAFQLGEPAARRAIELDSTLTDAHISAAIIRCTYRHDPEGAEASFRRALSLDPNSGNAHYFYSSCLSRAGRMPAALAEAERAVQLEPLNGQFVTAIGRAYVLGGQPNRAIPPMRSALRIAPDLSSLYVVLALAYGDAGDTANADWAVENVRRTYRVPGVGEVVRAYAAARLGRRELALAELRAAGDHLPQSYQVYAAAVHAALGTHDRAMQLLELAYSQGGDYFGFVHAPVFDPLRGTLAFQRFASRYNLPLAPERLD
jgi:serine/threonine protein kinase/tetratricopeptide (TPR) repeat protein